MSRVPALLLTLTCACCLLGCGRQRDSVPSSSPSSAGPATPAPAVVDVAPWLADPTRPLKELEGFVAQGLSADSLRRAALLHASALGADALVDAFRAIEDMGGATGALFAEALSIPEATLEETLEL